ncbi:MAG: hypothetical protein LBH21_05565 [Gracilibacteraceae bacterium]|jgi:Mn-dependent DtxR family transcriptional regulator|nr:hypothetical protein [Gracilibacteraceae bacterium]
MSLDDAKLTDLRLSHLLYYYLHRGGNRTMSAAASFFGVSRQSARKVFTWLSDSGYLEKDDSKVVLTNKGLEVIREQRGYLEEIGISFEAAFGAPPVEAWLDAFQIIHTLSDEKAAYIAKGAAFLRAFTALRNLGADTFNENLRCGQYGIFLARFTVYKESSRLVSMGDQGFRSPARLILGGDGEAALELTAKTFRYESLADGKSLRGALKRLWFKQGERWVLAPEAQGRRLIPGGALRLDVGTGFCRGVVRIKAESSAPEMPRSQADIHLEVDFGERYF